MYDIMYNWKLAGSRLSRIGTWSRYKYSEVVQLDYITDNWELEWSILSRIRNRLQIQTKRSRPNSVPFENVGGTWQNMSKERKLMSRILKNNEFFFLNIMRWVFFIRTIGYLLEKCLYCRVWMSCVVQSQLNQGGCWFNSIYKINVNKYG